MQHFISLLIILLLSTNVMFAQNVIEEVKNYNMAEVVVSANRSETPLYEIGNSISVIGTKQIENSGKSTVIELLSEVPGLSVAQQGGPGKLALVFMRGANSNHILVLIDGVEMNIPTDPGNVFDFSSLSLSGIERIEILRGPQSTIYGSNALAGVIQIITKKPTEINKYFLNMEGGSYSTYSGNIGTTGKLNNFTYSADYSRYSTGGFSSASEKYGNTENDGFQNDVVSAKLGYSFSENISVRAIGRFTKSDVDLDQIGGLYGDDPNYTTDLEETLLRFETNANFFDGNWEQSLSVSYLRNFRKYKDEIDVNHPATSSDSAYDGNKLKFEWLNKIKLTDNNVVIAGIETEEETAKSEYNSISSWGPYNSIFPSQSIRTSGIYIQDQFNALPNLFLNLGLRYDDHEMFGSVFTYRISPVYFITSTDTKLKATYGTGFKAPSLYYLYDPTYGNTELDPEESIGWDAGVEQYLFNSRLTLGVTYFNNSFENLFGFDAITYQTINISKAETYGVEVSVNSSLHENLNINFNYTYTHTEDKSENTKDSGLDLLRRPQNKVALIVNYSPIDKLNLNFEGIYAGQRKDKDFSVWPAERINLSEYTLLNFAAKYKLYDFLTLQIRLQNILDEEYEEIFGYGTSGFSIYGGFGITL